MSSALDDLPADLGRHRVFSTRESAEYTGNSYAEWRAKHARGETPPAVQVGVRKLGWRVSDLLDYNARRLEAAATTIKSERSRAQPRSSEARPVTEKRRRVARTELETART
jgi:predicted DNA-binding transcriptional regulator AlpA